MGRATGIRNLQTSHVSNRRGPIIAIRGISPLGKILTSVGCNGRSYCKSGGIDWIEQFSGSRSRVDVEIRWKGILACFHFQTSGMLYVFCILAQSICHGKSEWNPNVLKSLQG